MRRPSVVRRPGGPAIEPGRGEAIRPPDEGRAPALGSPDASFPPRQREPPQRQCVERCVDAQEDRVIVDVSLPFSDFRRN